MRKTGLAASSFALAVTISSLLFAQPAPMPPPAPIMPPSLPPSHVVNLMTNEGSAVFGAQWRVGDVKIVEVPAAINKERYKTAYQFEPRAMATDFDEPNGNGRGQGPRCPPQRRPCRLPVVPRAADDAGAGRQLRPVEADTGGVQRAGRHYAKSGQRQMPRRSAIQSSRDSTCPIVLCLAPRSRPAINSR